MGVKTGKDTFKDQHIYTLLLSSTDCKTVGGPDVGKPCVFPFKINNVTYNACITDEQDSAKHCTVPGEEEQQKTRCSTLVDEKGNHVDSDHWGYCGDECPIDGLGKNNAT